LAHFKTALGAEGWEKLLAKTGTTGGEQLFDDEGLNIPEDRLPKIRSFFVTIKNELGSPELKRIFNYLHVASQARWLGWIA